MIRLKRRLLVFVCASMLSAPAVHAAEPRAMYVPTSGWLVGPASLSPTDGARMPCIMMNQYDNGYTFRFSGGNKKILAVAIDFRQSVFTEGTSYPLTFEIPPSFSKKVDGVAYNEAILMVTASDAEQAADLYKALDGGQELHLGLGARTIDFALLGTSDGLQRIETCYNPESQKKQWSASASDSGHQDKPQKSDTPAVPDIDPDPQHHSDATPVDAQLAKVAADIKPAAVTRKPLANVPAIDPSTIIDPSAAGGTTGPNWQATRGASLRDILDTWSRKGNVRLNWTTKHDFPIKQTISVSGSFEQAVQRLVAQFENEKNKPLARVYMEGSQQVLLIREE